MTRQQGVRPRQMRAVIHLAVDADRACAGLGGERSDYGFRLFDLLLPWV